FFCHRAAPLVSSKLSCVQFVRQRRLPPSRRSQLESTLAPAPLGSAHSKRLMQNPKCCRMNPYKKLRGPLSRGLAPLFLEVISFEDSCKIRVAARIRLGHDLLSSWLSARLPWARSRLPFLK